MNFSSKLLEAAVNEFAQLPGIGEKTALRLVLHLLNEPASGVERFTAALTALKNNIQYCQVCRNISDHPVCEICSSPRRDRSVVCVVEDTRDVMAIENTAQYTGLYHVLGGVISPINGIGPGELKIEPLIERLTSGQSQIKEVILATNPTVEGEATAFYISERAKKLGVVVSRIAHGVPLGGELEFIDGGTLAHAFSSRRHV